MSKKITQLAFGLLCALAFLLQPTAGFAQKPKKTSTKNTGELELWSKTTSYSNSSGSNKSYKSLLVGYKGGEKRDLKNAYKFDFKTVYKKCPTAMEHYNLSMSEFKSAKKLSRFALLGFFGASIAGTAAAFAFKKGDSAINMPIAAVGMGLGAAIYMGFAFPMHKHSKNSTAEMACSVEEYNKKCLEAAKK